MVSRLAVTKTNGFLAAMGEHLIPQIPKVWNVFSDHKIKQNIKKPTLKNLEIILQILIYLGLTI